MAVSAVDVGRYMCRRRVAVLPLAASPQAHLLLGLADDRADTLQIVGMCRAEEQAVCLKDGYCCVHRLANNF